MSMRHSIKIRYIFFRKKIFQGTTILLIIILFLLHYLTSYQVDKITTVLSSESGGTSKPSGEKIKIPNYVRRGDPYYVPMEYPYGTFTNDTDNGKDGKWITWPECECNSDFKNRECLPTSLPKNTRSIKYEEGGSCSWRAWQHSTASVISVAAYGIPSRYVPKLTALIGGLDRFYPGWSLWVYIRHANPKLVCEILKTHSNVFFCDTRSIPSLGDLKRNSPFAWKFSALGDHRVRRVIFKDLDNSPLERESAAVKDWLQTNYTYHIALDHPSQAALPPLHHIAVQYDVKEVLDMQALRNILMEKSRPQMERKDVQAILSAHLWPKMLSSSSILTHSAYECKQGPKNDVKPWPTQRKGNTFVGMKYGPTYLPLPDCPVECRPNYNKNWNKC